MLTSLTGEGAREVAMARNRRQASRITDAVIEYARRLMGGGPWKPEAEATEADAPASAQCTGSARRTGSAPARGQASPPPLTKDRPASFDRFRIKF